MLVLQSSCLCPIARALSMPDALPGRVAGSDLPLLLLPPGLPRPGQPAARESPAPSPGAKGRVAQCCTVVRIRSLPPRRQSQASTRAVCCYPNHQGLTRRRRLTLGTASFNASALPPPCILTLLLPEPPFVPPLCACLCPSPVPSCAVVHGCVPPQAWMGLDFRDKMGRFYPLSFLAYYLIGGCLRPTFPPLPLALEQHSVLPEASPCSGMLPPAQSLSGTCPPLGQA